MKFTEIFSSKNLFRPGATKKEIGDRGEELAARRLKKEGYKILERNFSVPRLGELDIIATDGDCLCFVEVRTRSGSDFGTPAETVTREKQRRIIRTAEAYICANRIANTAMRFDVVEVFAGENPRVEIIKNAFWA